MSSEERREQIIASAYRVFVRSGLAGARTRDIADEAGVNEALVYQHFRSKEELFETVIVTVFAEARRSLAADLDSLPPARQHDADEVTDLMTRQVRRLLVAFGMIEPLLGVVLYGKDEIAARHFEVSLQPYFTDTRAALIGFLPFWAHGSFDPERAVEALIGVVWTRVLVARMSGQEFDHDIEARAIAEMLLVGMLAR